MKYTVSMRECKSEGEEFEKQVSAESMMSALQTVVSRRWGRKASFSVEHNQSLHRGHFRGQVVVPQGRSGGSSCITGTWFATVEEA